MEKKATNMPCLVAISKDGQETSLSPQCVLKGHVIIDIFV